MSIKVRGLNSDETFCCSKKEFKSIFGTIDEDFSVYFGDLPVFSRDEVKNGDKRKSVRQGYNNPEKYVLLGMMIFREKDEFGHIGFMWFSILKKAHYSETQRQKFLKKALPKIYDLYKKYKGNRILEESEFGRYELEVVMVGDEFIFNENIR